MKIADTSEFNLVCKEGVATMDECHIQWEKIMRLSNKIIGNREYDNYFFRLKAFAKMFEHFNLVKGYLAKLVMGPDDEAFAYLKKSGYRIRQNDGQHAYEEDIFNALNKSNDLLTKLKIKKNELDSVGNRVGESKKISSFDESMAHISKRLKFTVPEEISLARFNEYRVLIKHEDEEIRQQQRKAKRK